MRLPPLPSTVGKKGLATDPSGHRFRFVVMDEVRQQHTGHPDGKFIILQKIRFEDDRSEFRLCYYIIGKKPGMRGKWVFGQYATMMPPADFKALIQKARAKGWI